MANNFITNTGTHKTLKGRLNTLISISDELKFLVGFFYFSGWREVYEGLKNNENIQLKLLVGLQVDRHLHHVIEHGNQESGMSHDDHFNVFVSSLGTALNNEDLDTKEFYEQVEFFTEMLKAGRLLIRKALSPNHAKLYLFRLDEDQAEKQNMEGEFLTGSSNLTKAGLLNQEEFNVEIRDYGFMEAEQYFDDLWDMAVPITEVSDRKDFVLQFIQHKTQAATVTPFEAYALILKTYLDLQQQKQMRPEIEGILEQIGFKRFSYQIDAVNQALTIIEEYNGVVIADVVGLGKSVIAALIAKNIGKRGMVICPPGLIGDKDYSTGWWGYVNQFGLNTWDVRSKGKLVDIAENIHDKGIEVVIVDEAHYFRNEDTEDYEALWNICQGRTVILLSATPFNNSPKDIFSLLKLFIVPGKSGITIDDNLEALFTSYNTRFNRLSYITKSYHSPDEKKREKAQNYYLDVIGEKPPVEIEKVDAHTMKLANEIKNTISPVLIRRNRLDLKEDHEYSLEIGELPEIENPVELFYELSPAQSQFYDRIIEDYFSEDGRFTGAIYQPFQYEKKQSNRKKLDEEGNRVFQQQRNLYDFMRRILVKRFESSFGAFAASIDRFIKVHEVVEKFIETSGGKFILDRDLIESIYEKSEEEILDVLHRFENNLLNKKIRKDNTVYEINSFERKEEFFRDMESDKKLFRDIRKELLSLDLVSNDPKRITVLETVKSALQKNPDRKIVLFSEYVATVNHLKEYFIKNLDGRVLVCDGKMSKALEKKLHTDFDAQFRGEATNNYDLLVTSDKLSEGYNLNRAGLIVNYDIPWNPTRVIQRVGRINRIGTKVFDKLYIYNYFPTEAGSDIVKSREIASQKMFLIHNALGEDSKIFSSDEEPTASGLYNKINETVEDDTDLNITTHIRNLYKEISEKYPEVISRISSLPARVKTAKCHSNSQLLGLRRKGLSLQSSLVENPVPERNKVNEIIFDELIPLVSCGFEEEKLNFSENFWPAYEALKFFKPVLSKSKSERSLEKKAMENLKVSLRVVDPAQSELGEFIKTLIKDIRHYHTLSRRTLRRIGSFDLSLNASEHDKKLFFTELEWIFKTLGKDYLSKILEKVKHLKSEVIIAVENRGG